MDTVARDRLIQRILRVNHAGEHGAVSIYSSQINRAQKRFPELLPWLEETLAHEQSHRKVFHEMMPARGAKPCRALFVWKFGGTTLGALTAMFGKFGVMVCTAAVERTVHAHLIEQISFLKNHDIELANAVETILEEELLHLEAAKRGHNSESFAARAVSAIIGALTEILIFLSTRGDSLRLRSLLRSY